MSIEAYPDIYILQPGDVMRVEFDPGKLQPGLHVILHPDGSQQIYLDEFDTASVFINNLPTKPANSSQNKTPG